MTMIFGIIIGVLLLVLVFMVSSMMVRRSIQKQIDELDARKQRLLGAHVPNELQKFKTWPMEGETKERFERWHQSWDELVSVHMGQISDVLYRIEEDTERYRFWAAKSELRTTTELLEELEAFVKGMLDEMSAYEETHERLVELTKRSEKELYQLRKTLIAQNGSFGSTYALVEERIASAEAQRNELTLQKQQGEVSKAYEIGQTLTSEVEHIRHLVEVIPSYVRIIRIELKQQMYQLRSGYKEMQLDGYALDALQLLDEIERAEEQRETLSQQIEELDVLKFDEEIQHLEGHIDRLYDTFQAEIDARQYVRENLSNVRDQTFTALEQMGRLEAEMSRLASNYEMNLKLEDGFDQLKREHISLETQFDEMNDLFSSRTLPFSSMKGRMQEFYRMLEQFSLMYERFMSETNSMRKEEIELRTKLEGWNRELSRYRRILAKTSMPIVPEGLLTDLSHLQKGLVSLEEQFEKIPLNMTYIVGLSHDLEEAIHQFAGRVDSSVRQVVYGEQLLQYANRYRRTDEETHVALALAETKFLNGEFSTAIEIGERVLQRFDEKQIFNIQEKVERELEQTQLLRK